MDTLKKQFPLFLTIVAGVLVATLAQEQIAKMRVKASA